MIRRPPASTWSVSDKVRFSVVTPTHGRPASLLRMLGALRRQDYPLELFEVVVVIDGEDRSLASTLSNSEFPFRFRFLTQKRGGPAAARNLALEHATESHVLFIDDDVVPAPTMMREHAGSHREPNVAVIGPLVAVGAGRPSPWTRWEWATLEKQYRSMLAGKWPPTPRQFYTGNASVRLDAVRDAGGFDVRYSRGEDVELGWRLHDRGVRFVFNPQARAEHHAERSFSAWLLAAREYGRADVMLERSLSGAELPAFALEEFQWRHRYTRLFTRAVVALPGLWSGAAVAIRAGMLVSDRLGWDAPTRQACSALFNAAYWLGVREQVQVDLTTTLRAAERPLGQVAAS